MVNIFELQRATCRKSAILTYPTCIWCLHWGDPFEFCRDIRHKKTVVPGVLCGVVCIILCLAVSVEHRLVTHFCNLNQNKQHCCWVKLTPADSFQSLLSAILTYKPGSMFMMRKLAMSLYGLTIQPCSLALSKKKQQSNYIVMGTMHLQSVRLHKLWWECTWKITLTRMWANAQPDGRPAEHRWRPLFNAAKFGWRPLLDAVQ